MSSSRLNGCIERHDAFGYRLQLHFQNQSEHKTKLGGIISISIKILMLCLAVATIGTYFTKHEEIIEHYESPMIGGSSSSFSFDGSLPFY